MEPISNSELQAWLTCPRKWWYEYQLGYRPATKSEAMTLGTDVHDILESYYLGDLDKANQKTEAASEMVQTMMAGYVRWLAETGYDDFFEIIGVEEKIEATINDIPFRGIYDLLVQDKQTGQHFYIDHKTGADFRLETYSSHSSQIRLYHCINYMSEQQTVAGTYLNMLKKSKQTRRATPPFYKRDFTPLKQAVVERDLERFAYWGAQIIEARKTTEPPHAKLTTSCSFCPYREPCHAEDLGENFGNILETAFSKENPDERYNT